jgi:hypothetical protein
MKEAVDDILRGHGEFDRLAHRNVQLVDLALAVGVLQFPHPLLAHHQDFHGVRGRLAVVEKDLGPPPEDDQHQHQQGAAAHDFQRAVLVRLLRHVGFRTPPVLDRKQHHQHRGQDGEENADGHQEDVQRVNLAGHGGGLLGQQFKNIVHSIESVSSSRR